MSPFKEIDRVGQPGNVLIMRGHDESLPGVTAQLKEQLQNFVSGSFIEVAGRLVSQEQDRVMDESARDGHALLFATTEPVREGIEAVAKTDPLQQVFGAAVAFSVTSRQFHRQGDVFENGERRDQIEELEYDSDIAAPEERTLMFVQGSQLDFTALLPDKDSSLGRTVDTGDEIEERALTTAGLSQKADELAGRDRTVDRFQHTLLLPGLGVRLPKCVKTHEQRRSFRRLPVFSRSTVHGRITICT